MDSGRKRLENEGFRARYRKTVQKITGDKGDKRSCFKSKLEIQIYKNVGYSESLDFVTTALSFRQQRPDKTCAAQQYSLNICTSRIRSKPKFEFKNFTGSVVAMHPEYMMSDCLPPFAPIPLRFYGRKCWGLVEEIRTFCLGQIHPTYSEKLSWKFAWNVKMIIDAVDPHRRPGTKAQQVEMFVGCEPLPYKVSGHIF